MELKKDTKKYYEITAKFLSQKKVQNILVAVLFLAILFVGAYIRIQPLPNLVDPTTGDYTPLALDPYYFLRVSETLLETGGELPEVDEMHYGGLNSTWSEEILPKSTILIYHVMKTFDQDTTLRFANVLNPVIFFVLGLIVFFFLILFLTKNKWLAIIASFILTVIPPYLYRTLAGFSDHESIGMFGFFLALLFFTLGMLYLEKRKLSYIKSIILGLIAGLMTMFAIASWGGGAKFLFMILPLTFLINWFVNPKSKNWNSVLFYGAFLGGIAIFSSIFGFTFNSILNRYLISSTGILTFFALGYSIIELIVLKAKFIHKKLKENSELVSIVSVFILGGIFYQAFIGNFFSMIGHLLSKIVSPFGTGRVGLTVAENKQPYLIELIAQVGKTVFYAFLAGCFIVGGKLASGIKKKKLRYLFTGSFAFFVFGILFSRISSSSLLNGENFISKAFFFISFLILLISSIYICRKSEWKIKVEWIIIAAWMIPMLLAVRSAIRVFFAIVPFIAMMVPFALFELAKFTKKSKDSLVKLISFVLTILLILALIVTLFGFYSTVKTQATYQSPSYNSDWQNAMDWVRSNTPEGSIFLHWWDYGYWVQTGGERPTVTDGGHFNGHWDHLIGRYVLTTPYPETAKSFMKSHDVSYFLMDPTDIGKYSAYSSIGDDLESSDRASYLATFISDPKEIQETKEGVIRLYRGGIYLDSDIFYEFEGEEIFLPQGKALMGGIILEKINGEYSQPRGIYVYNNQQYEIPIKNLFSGGELYVFEEGIDATIYLYANVVTSNTGQQFDLEGAVIYLSEKTKDSLVAKLYLMGDVKKDYSELELVYSEGQYPFNFYYQGFRGPIKIWEVGEMPTILAREEFLSIDGEYGEFDELQFII